MTYCHANLFYLRDPRAVERVWRLDRLQCHLRTGHQDSDQACEWKKTNQASMPDWMSCANMAASKFDLLNVL